MGRPPLASSAARVLSAALLISANLLTEVRAAGGRGNNGGQSQAAQQAPVDFDCPEEFGYYAHPSDCTLYYVCVFGGALLESCTGGLMYSHELQTCDWPRNVGCSSGQQQVVSQPQQQQHISQKLSQQQAQQAVDVSSSRGRQRQQQIQIPKADLYTEEEELGPAEELESDRQQRVYRGQPSTLGQVASDRDGLSTHSNAIPVPSSGGRDKLSVVSYGAQQQYNSKNKRRQTNGVDNSDHNFLTNISRVRKKRDSTNSNRRSPVKEGRRRKKSGRRLRRQEEAPHDSKKSSSSEIVSRRAINKPFRSNPPDRNDEEISDERDRKSRSWRHHKPQRNEENDDVKEKYENGDDEEVKEKSKVTRDSIGRGNNEEEDYEEDDNNNEDYEDEEEDDEEGAEETDVEENDEKEKDDRESSKSNEDPSSGEINFNDSKEKNSNSSENFKIDFPDPPSSWDSFEDFKFPFDELDFDFDKFLADLKNDKFDEFDVFEKDKNGPSSTTVYPTSIFNFGSTSYSPFLETSTISSPVRFNFYFPHFNSNKNKSIEDNGSNENSNNDYDFSDGSKNSDENRLSSRADKRVQWESTKLPVSTLESPIERKTYMTNIYPHRKPNSNTGNSATSKALHAEDRMGNIDSEQYNGNEFQNNKNQQLPHRNQLPSRLNNSFASLAQSKWLTGDGPLQNPSNRRGTAKFTFFTSPISSPTTTPKYPSNENSKSKTLNFGRRTTEQTNTVQVTPKYSVQSTKPTFFGGNQEYRVTYSTLPGGTFQQPKNQGNDKHFNVKFTTSKPAVDIDSTEFLRRSTESLRSPSLTPTFTSITDSKDQHVVSYSYPSVTFQESRGTLHRGNPQRTDRQFGKAMYAIPVSQANIRQSKVNPVRGNRKSPSHVKYGMVRQSGPPLNYQGPTFSSANRHKFIPSPTRQSVHRPSSSRPKHHHPRNFGSGDRLVNKNHQNAFNRLNPKPQNIRQYISFKNNPQSSKERDNNSEREKDVGEEDLRDQYNKKERKNTSQEKINTSQNDEGIPSGYRSQERRPESNLKPNSTVLVNNGLHTFSYVNIHDNEKANDDKTSHELETTTHSPSQLIGGFRPSMTWNTVGSTPQYKLDPNETDEGSTLGVIDLPVQKLNNDDKKTHPPAGSYVFFKSNIGPTVAVPVQPNNLYGNHKENNEDNYNDYYNEYDEGDYKDSNQHNSSAPKPPPVPKTLQNIDYKDYDDPEYDEYNEDENEYDEEDDDEEDGYDDKSKKENTGKQLKDEEYYDEEEEEDKDEQIEEPKPEESAEQPKAAMASATTVNEVGCIPPGVTPLPGKEANLCPSEKPTDRPTTTADEQNNSEQTRRTITLLRASVQPIQQQVYEPRGYNSTRYIQQQQYDPNYYTVYDEEAEQYRDIADYASQYVQQKQQDNYSRKKPSVEIIQQEQIQRASPYPKTKYSNQQDNIYQSVTPQEYDSYSIQTNDDIPYRQVQTKSNNRFPEVKESGTAQGERRLITLSAKFSHEVPEQTNSQTNTDNNRGKSSSESNTEANVVNITPRRDSRVSASSEVPTGAKRNNPSFAQEINSLAQSGEAEDPVVKGLEALTKSEEYLSDEGSTEMSSENRKAQSSVENSKPLTVEEVDISYLRGLKSQSSNSGTSSNRFRFSPRSEEKATTEQNVISHYRIGLNENQSSATSSSPSIQQGNRQAKVINEEITTPKPLIFQFQDYTGVSSYERGTQQGRNNPGIINSDESNSKNVASNTRVRGSMRHQSSENQNERNEDHWPQHYNQDDRQSGKNLQRKSEQLPIRTTYNPTQSPLRITVPSFNNDNIKEQILRQYKAHIENTRKQQSVEEEPNRRGLISENNDPPRVRPTVTRNYANQQSTEHQLPTESNSGDSSQQIRIKVPDKNSGNLNPRERLMPLSDFVNSNVNKMIEVNRNQRPISMEDDKSIEEQESEEARRPVSIRIPDMPTQRSNEDRRSYVDARQQNKGDNDYSRKPIRYSDSLEYKDHTRGSTRFNPSSSEEYDNDDLINVTEEPQKPIAVRIPQRANPTMYRSREQGTYSNEPSNVEISSRYQPESSSQEPKQNQEERRRIVPPALASRIQSNSNEPQVAKPIAIRVPDSIDLNHYQSRDQSTAARVVDSLSPIRNRERPDEENIQQNDYRPRLRIDDESKMTNDHRIRGSALNHEEVRNDEPLRNRYEVATTLRPNRVLSIPTTTKPTRPPKKFRNGTQYSDLTLPIGTDETYNNQQEPEPTLRARPMSHNAPTTPGLTRGGLRHRGSLTYTVSPNEAEPPQPRGTPATQRGRPTLKPSTTVVGKASEYQDVYRFPASRPENVYPTPQVDKTAAKCRKDVCLLPDCYCGGKDVPGELTPEETPQIVLLTFDDSVNDLNKGLYSDLFEKGRVNPNGCPISATFYVSHEWTDYSQVQNLYAGGHEIASHSVSHSFGEQFSQKKWTREIAGQREILAAYGGVKLEDVRGMRAPFLAVGGNKMFKMLYDSNFTYDSSMPVYENRPPSWPYTLDYKIFHDCMIPPCPTKSYPGVWEVPMVMWQDLNGGRCSMGDACSNPPNAEGVYKMLIKNFERHFTSNRAPFGLFYHAAWFTQPHHKEGFIAFLDTINKMPEVWLVTNWQAVQWVRDPTPLSRLGNFAPFQCNYQDRPKKCNNPKVCNLWHKSGVRYMRTCQACPEVYPWTGKSGVRNSRVDNDLE